MSQSLLVLAVPHRLQGPNFNGYIEDPDYRLLVESFLKDGVDFVFEEASGRGPSVAEESAKLQSRAYLDVDPSAQQRPEYGLASETETWGPIDPWNSQKMYSKLNLDEQRKREELWLLRIQGKSFEKGLMICGTAHSLSFAFRLRAAGFGTTELFSYGH